MSNDTTGQVLTNLEADTAAIEDDFNALREQMRRLLYGTGSGGWYGNDGIPRVTMTWHRANMLKVAEQRMYGAARRMVWSRRHF